MWIWSCWAAYYTLIVMARLESQALLEIALLFRITCMQLMSNVCTVVVCSKNWKLMLLHFVFLCYRCAYLGGSARFSHCAVHSLSKHKGTSWLRFQIDFWPLVDLRSHTWDEYHNSEIPQPDQDYSLIKAATCNIRVWSVLENDSWYSREGNTNVQSTKISHVATYTKNLSPGLLTPFSLFNPYSSLQRYG